MNGLLSRVRRLLALAVVAGLVAACAPPGSGGGQQSGPIKIGLLSPTTGTTAASGTDLINGWNLYWKLKGAKVANREVQTNHEDTGGDPTVALTKARQLVEQNKVSMLVGPLLANEAYALADYVKTNGTPLLMPVGSSDDLTQRAHVPTVIRIAGWTSSQPHHPFGEWAAEQGCDGKPCKKLVTICTDYAFGHEVCGGFSHTFTLKGGQIVQQLWNPIGTPDYSSYLSQMPGFNADGVFALAVGADSIRFVKQWNEFGYKGKIPLLGGEVLLDQSLLRGMGPEAEGLISAGHFAEGRTDKGTADFAEAYLKEYNQLPSYYAASGYTAALWIVQALEKTNGDTETKKFLEAVRGVTLDDSPMGPMKLDKYDNPIENAYVRKVEKRPDGKLWNVPIKTTNNVSQFWTFNPEEFLKKPVYSRSYQGLPGQ
ncbi:MAG: ABC transporter substrate-binding protein [Chloroflexi bacterium]|nr:ABC transporter substrate-binding protein [Chloroflexota bacterium]